MLTDTICEDPRWQDAGLPALAEHAAGETLRILGLDPGYEIAVLGCDDARIAALNADFRGKPSPTNVLSWPAEETTPDTPPAGPELGDIAIAWETCAREAAAQGKPFEAHVLHLLVHGTLHLLGHDHVAEAEAQRMEDLERAVLAALGLPDPYL
jgi:probable rRNA maturation factor